MSLDAYKNGASSTLASGISNTDSTLSVAVGTASKFPVAPFNCIVWNATDYPNPVADPLYEIVRVDTVIGDLFEIERAQESTTANNHNIAGKTYGIAAAVTAKIFNTDIPMAINNVKAMNWFLS